MNRGYVYRTRVAAGDAGLDVVAYHVRRFRHSPEETWREHVGAGRVLVNGAPAGADIIVRAGDVLEFHRPPWSEPDAPLECRIVHEDDEILAVSKPAGLQVLPAGRFLERTLLHVVRAGRPERAEWSPVHRIGRGTTGLVLFGKTARARAMLCAQFRECRAGKLYLALVRGVDARSSYAARQSIGPVPHGTGRVHTVTEGGRPSLTLVRVLRRDAGADTTLVAAKPVTGRTDQIRIHLAACGHPIVGDPLYAEGARPLPGARPGDIGYLLHATSLRFEHPSGHWLKLRCPAPW